MRVKRGGFPLQQERLSVLQKIAEEHQIYHSYVLKFQAWLVSKAKELNTLTETEDTAENNLRALQVRVVHPSYSTPGRDK